MVSNRVVGLCHSSETVTSMMGKNPDTPVELIIKNLYHTEPPSEKHDGRTGSPDSGVGLITARDALETARECGRWPQEQTPSLLFLQAFADAISCLEIDPMAGMVSPPLMGTHGLLPLTMISPLVDIIRHNARLIRNAEKEVFFSTSVWTPSQAQGILKDALVDLSKRAEANGRRVSVKIMFDKAALSHVVESHRIIDAKTYSSKANDLPSPEEIPGIDLEVMSLHKFVLGTLHTKFCIVDRKIATIMSNNVEDNANLEMMVQVEGPIVSGVYDSALITWNKTVGHKPSQTSDGSELDFLSNQVGTAGTGSLNEEILAFNETYQGQRIESNLEAVNKRLNRTVPNPVKPSGPEISDEESMTPCISTLTTTSIPMALVSRPPYGPCDSQDRHVPQNEAWLSLIRNAQKSVFIQTPNLNAEPLLHEIVEALKRGVEVVYYVCFGYNDAGEMIPGQGGTNEQAAQRIMNMLPAGGHELRRLHVYNYVAKDQDHPIHQSMGSRACHIKVMIVDGQVGVQGSGNQDNQSWFHSQEMNIMVDSPEICAKWRQGLDQNQNTSIYGRCWDGIWRDKDGNPGERFSGNPGAVGGLFKGLVGMGKKTLHQRKHAK